MKINEHASCQHFALKIRATKRRDLHCQGGHSIKPGKYVERTGLFGVQMFYCQECSKNYGWVE